jgi:hypothetical protein
VQERRQEERLSWAAKIRIEDISTKRQISADSRLRNIAKHGFSFVTEDHLTRGGLYKFTILLPTSQLEFTARVVHFHIEATYYVCGARIEGLSLMQRSRINHFLSSKSPVLQRRFLMYAVISGVVLGGIVKLALGASIGVAVTVAAAVSIFSFLLLPF